MKKYLLLIILAVTLVSCKLNAIVYTPPEDRIAIQSYDLFRDNDYILDDWTYIVVNRWTGEVKVNGQIVDSLRIDPNLK